MIHKAGVGSWLKKRASNVKCLDYTITRDERLKLEEAEMAFKKLDFAGDGYVDLKNMVEYFAESQQKLSLNQLSKFFCQ